MKKNLIIISDADLRLLDNPALFYGLQDKIIPTSILFIPDLDAGIVKKLWVKKILSTFFIKELDNLNKKFYTIDEHSKKNQCVTIKTIIEMHNITDIYSNNRFGSFYTTLREILQDLNNITYHSLSGNTLINPQNLKNKQHENYKVFTPFYKAVITLIESIENPLPLPEKHNAQECLEENIIPNLLCNSLPSCYTSLTKKKYYQEHNLIDTYTTGTDYCIKHTQKFIKEKNIDYKKNRDFPAIKNACSGLSYYLNTGQISPKIILYLIKKEIKNYKNNDFLREIIWRDFAHYNLYYYPDLDTTERIEKFRKFAWKDNQEFLSSWQKGLTGYPIVDAGMRELYKTGTMHNRVRMIVGSFLIKDLLISWKEGQAWFWNRLIDADLASNAMNWQWVAGTGIDASPYFRVFNPSLQSKKFDPSCIYIKKWVPELQHIDPRYIHNREKLSIDNYPNPLVDHKQARTIFLQLLRTYGLLS